MMRRHEPLRSPAALVCAIIITGVCAQHGAAEVVNGPDYISVLPGYSIPSKRYGTPIPNGTLGLDDTTGHGATLSVIYGHQFASRFALEFNLQTSIFETGRGNGTDFYQYGGTVDLVYLLSDRKAAGFTFFALGGVGAGRDDFYPNTLDGMTLLVNAGLGLVTKPLFSNGLRFRVEGRYVYDQKNGGHGEGRILAGIDIPLGRIDRHVEYLPGKVEIREVIKEVPRPYTDSDGDGVDDEHDQCPNTPRGVHVDAHGCAIELQNIAMQGVTFHFNEARLTPNAEAVLTDVSAAFLGQPSLRAEIAAHTDSVGSAQGNLLLSQQRAESVRRYLLAKGVHPNQLTTHGYGKSQPLIDPERSDADRERNRRVELRVLTP